MPTTDHMNVREILDAYKSESIDLELAENKIRKSFYSDLGHTLLDLDREAGLVRERLSLVQEKQRRRLTI